MALETPNLRLEYASPDRLRAFLDGSPAYQGAFAATVAEGLREFWKEVPQTWIDKALQATPEEWKLGFHVIHKADRALIGMCALKGPPDKDGVAEIAYGIAPGYQGRGYATEAARAVTEHFFAIGLLQRIRAHTLAQENPSTSVLKKLGYTKIGEVIEPDDGLVWRWERGPS